MQEVICSNSSRFPDALSYATRYKVLKYDSEKQQYQIIGSNGRKRWFPAYCFSSAEVPVYSRFSVEDYETTKEIVLQLEDGSSRWFILAGPEFLTQSLKTNKFYCDPSTVFVEDLNAIDVADLLLEIQDSGNLLSVTQPLVED